MKVSKFTSKSSIFIKKTKKCKVTGSENFTICTLHKHKEMGPVALTGETRNTYDIE
jgi:hypothetical protein